MKPKFRLGDRVTVINPYVAPIPDYVKDSEIFNDLYKAFGLDKDIRGVKPGDTYIIIEAESKPPVPTAKLFMPILTRAKAASVPISSCGKMKSS